MQTEKDNEDLPSNEIDDELLEALLEGLDYVLKIFVGSDNVLSITNRKAEEQNLFMSIITFGYKAAPKDENFFKKHEDVGRNILGNLKNLLNAVITCWDMDATFSKAADFTVEGCLGYNIEKIKHYVTNVDLKDSPKINQKIITIVRPFGYRFMKYLVEELIKYWIDTFVLLQKEEADKVTKILQTIVEIPHPDEHYLRLSNGID
jgi:hypothetical protein